MASHGLVGVGWGFAVPVSTMPQPPSCSTESVKATALAFINLGHLSHNQENDYVNQS